MRRFHEEVFLMLKRKKQIDRHFEMSARSGVTVIGRNRELGDFRKRRPFESCPPSNGCVVCQCERSRLKSIKRYERRQSKLILKSGDSFD